MRKLTPIQIKVLIEEALHRQMVKDSQEINDDLNLLLSQENSEEYNGQMTDYHLAIWEEIKEMKTGTKNGFVVASVVFSCNWELNATIEGMEAEFYIYEKEDGTEIAEIYDAQ